MTAPPDTEPVTRALFTVLGIVVGAIGAMLAYETEWGILLAGLLTFLLIAAAIITTPEPRT